jgi:hypothetical protein
MRIGVRHVALAAIALVISGLAWRDAAIAYWWEEDPASAPGFLRDDPRLALGTTEADLAEDDLSSNREAQEISARARAVLRSEPLDAPSLRDVALASEWSGDPVYKRQLLLAERISRRDLTTQRALLQISAENGDYGPSLARLDRILTIAPRAVPRFAEAMAALVSEPEGRSTLARYGSRPWFPDFALQAIGRVDDPRDMSALLLSVHIAKPDLQARLTASQLGRLIEADAYPEAREFAVRFGGIKPAVLDEFRPGPVTADRRWGPLGWKLASSFSADARLDGDGALQLDVRPDAAAVVAERITLLAPGTYELDQQLEPSANSDYVRLQWDVTCDGPGGGSVLWRQPVPVRPQPVRYRSQLELPASCPAQHWRLRANLDETQAMASLRLSGLELRRK